jgi:hypothetical protein
MFISRWTTSCEYGETISCRPATMLMLRLGFALFVSYVDFTHDTTFAQREFNLPV